MLEIEKWEAFMRYRKTEIWLGKMFVSGTRFNLFRIPVIHEEKI